MAFELWDTESNSLFGVFDTQEEALADVAATVNEYGRASAEALALLYHSEAHTIRPVADGPRLVDLATRAGPRATSTRPPLKNPARRASDTETSPRVGNPPGGVIHDVVIAAGSARKHGIGRVASARSVRIRGKAGMKRVAAARSGASWAPKANKKR